MDITVEIASLGELESIREELIQKIGNQEHRDVARQAVRESLVLLK